MAIGLAGRALENQVFFVWPSLDVRWLACLLRIVRAGLGSG